MKSLLTILLFFFICSVPTASNCQNPAQIGLSGGITYSNSWGRSQSPSIEKYGFGYLINSNITFSIDQKSFIRLSPNYQIQRSFHDINITNPSGAFVGEDRLINTYDYLVLPILYQMNLGKKQLFLVNAGPYIGYLFSVKQTINGGHLTQVFPNTTTEFNSTEGHKEIDLGFVGSFGVRIPINNQFQLTTEIRDQLGIYDIIGGFNSNHRSKRNSFQFLLGLNMNIGKDNQES